MRKYLLLTSMIVLSTGIASARTIDFDTIVEWNSEVIAKALDKAGFIGSNGALWDVRVTHERILSELVEKQSFSLRDATRVCLDKCNISDLLKNGRGQSGRKCPELCTGFVDALIVENNNNIDKNVLTPDMQDLSMKKLQDTPAKACRRLAQKAETSGLILPMLCGGMCRRFGDDTVIVTDKEKTIEYKIDDFCDNSEKNREYYYIVSTAGEMDVTGYNKDYRLVLLNKAQMQPITDYKNEQARKEQEKREAELQKKGAPYAKRVEQNGYCHIDPNNDVLRGTVSSDIDCKREARKFAQANACKLKNYGQFWLFDIRDGRGHRVECTINDNNSSYKSSSGYTDYEVIKYDYTPSYKDCVATFNEAKCDGAADGYEIYYY